MAPPNILLIVLDSVRRDHVGVYGHERPTTPEIDAFASEAIRYNQATAAAPWTPPSHAAMFSGLYASNVGVFGPTPSYDRNKPHVAELLSAAGYTTFGFSNSYHTSTDRGFDRGFEFYHDVLSLPRFAGKMYEPTLDYVRYLYDYFLKGYDLSAFQLRRLRTKIRRGDEPFFGFINLNSAHAPYDPPDPFRSEFEEPFDAEDTVNREAATIIANDDGYQYFMGDVSLSSTEWELVQRWYDGEIRYMDMLLGNFFNFLRTEGVFDDTLIVVTSDHGELFGEYGLVYHQLTLAEELIRVPLLIKRPGQTERQVSNELVSLVDLVPTFLDVVGKDVPSTLDGRSLFSDPEPDTVFAEYAGPYKPLREKLTGTDGFDEYDRGLQAARTKTRKLIVDTHGERTLYDISDGTDKPIEQNTVAKRLFERLNNTLGDIPDRNNKTEKLDEHVEQHLKEMGYM
jgi:arylsulfatase A-like enzyme